MSPLLAALPSPDPKPGSLTEKLLAVVRPEFQVHRYRPDPADPVLGGECAVVGCDGLPGGSRGLCKAHYARWHREGRADMADFVASAPRRQQHRDEPRQVDCFDLSTLVPQLRLEFAYVLQSRHDERRARLTRYAFTHVTHLVAAAGVNSLLDLSLDSWLAREPVGGASNARSFRALLRYAHGKLEELAVGNDPEILYTFDEWDARRLGIAVRDNDSRLLLFSEITPPWLRETTKRWARFRLASGRAYGSVQSDVAALRYFARFLAQHPGTLPDPSQLTRALLEDYLSWFSHTALAAQTRLNYLVGLRTFLDHCRRHGWMPGLPTSATLYQEDFPRTSEPLPRFVSEHVMAQLESDENLDRLPNPSIRCLVVVLMETGLRITDACQLVFSPVVDDSVGWPCLQFFNSKIAIEQLIPLSDKASSAIGQQQDYVRDRWPAGSPWLFPRVRTNPDGLRPTPSSSVRTALNRWQADIGLSDEAGQPTRATPHQFRHTLGTRMINNGVPQHVVQKMLGHKSPRMTARYATIHDTTVRAAFDDYQRSRVDIRGHQLPYDPQAASADAEWIKHNLARVAASLPNGYCGRPPQQECPHPNACLTCPDFQTTPQFLPLHRRQRDDTLVLVTAAEQAGNTRLADNHRQVAENLDRVITSLETHEPSNAS